MIKAVLFDFDGTLSGLDSNVAFARYCFRRSVRPWFYLPLMGVCGIVRWVRPAATAHCRPDRWRSGS